jgi:hypothetical protein
MSEPGTFDLFEPAVVAAHDDARDMWQKLLPPPALRDIDAGLYELHLDLSPTETLARWHIAHIWADQDPEAAWAQRNAEEHLRRVRPDAMAEYDRRVARGADPIEALRAATAQLSEPESPTPAASTRAALVEVWLDWEQRGSSPQWRADLGGGYEVAVYPQWRAASGGGFEATIDGPDAYQWAVQRWAERSSTRPWDISFDDPVSVAWGDVASVEAGRRAAEVVLGAVWGAAGDTAVAAAFLDGHPDFAGRVLAEGPVAANRAVGDDYLAAHPKFAARVAAHGAELAELRGRPSPTVGCCRWRPGR